MNIKLANFIDREIPPEIMKQLQIAGRIKRPLQPTSVSAVSTSEETPPILDEDVVKAKRDDLIKQVAIFEDLVEQLEDLADEHLKNMAIPPTSPRISSAAKALGSSDGTINQQVFNTANAIMDYFPILSLGYDPVLASLIGDGTVDGKWLDCNEITSNIAKQFDIKNRSQYQADQSIQQQEDNIADQHDQKLMQMVLEILLMLWWNMLWPKFLVDMCIINPTRVLCATPLDTLITFFIPLCGKGSFSKKPTDCLEGTNDQKPQGPINKLVTEVRKILLCKIPPKLYKRYKPMVQIDCVDSGKECEGTAGTAGPEDSKSKHDMSDMGGFMNQISNDKCTTIDKLIANANKDIPDKLGMSPECVKNAKIVLDAVMSNALTPPDGSNFSPTKLQLQEGF